jgi:glucose-6-phosphate isomerase
MLNARTCRKHILDHYKVPDDQAGDVLGKHLCAVSTNLEATRQFGIKDENVFGFWNWVGGRYSVSSAVGLLPLNLVYGHQQIEPFLEGLRAVDDHLSTAPLAENVPVLLGLLGWYNTHIAGHESRAILPYCQALIRFAAHIQ